MFEELENIVFVELGLLTVKEIIKKVYIKVAHTFYRVSMARVSTQFSVKGLTVNILGFAGRKGSVTIT